MLQLKTYNSKMIHIFKSLQINMAWVLKKRKKNSNTTPYRSPPQYVTFTNNTIDGFKVT